MAHLIETIQNLFEKHLKLISIILCLMYLVGFLGLQMPETRDVFIMLTPFNLWVSLILLLGFHKNWTWKATFIFSFVFLFGYFIEVLGVKTGQIFGIYKYGNTLGFKIFDVPLSIGANWLILTYSISYFTLNVFKKIIKSRIIIALIASFSMVILDFLIEPVAIKFDFWDWYNNSIPLQNYIAWFLVGFTLNYFTLRQNILQKNKIASLLLLLQLLFFVGHNFFITI